MRSIWGSIRRRPAVRRQCTPGGPPGSGDRDVLREPAQDAVGGAGRRSPPRCRLPRSSRPADNSTSACRAGRRARHPLHERRPWLLHDDADSDAARAVRSTSVITHTRRRSSSSTNGLRQLNFGASNPIGRHITLGVPHRATWKSSACPANVRYQGLKEEFVPIVFVPYDQGDWPPIEEMTFALRTIGDPLGYVSSVRDIVHRADARVPVTNIKTQPGEIEQTINQEIVFARLCTAFAVLALIIATVGCTARRPMRWPGGRARSGSAPPSARLAANVVRWCWAMSSCWLRWGW